MIYLIDDNTPESMIEEILDSAIPYSKEQLVDLIISKIDGRDMANFKLFSQKFESLVFKYKSIEDKKELYLKELETLEKGYQNKESWTDPSQLRSDLLNQEFSYHIKFDKKVLINYQIENLVTNAALLKVASKKKEYLTKELDKLTESNQNKKDLITQIWGNNNLKDEHLAPTSGNNKENFKEKKVPEKWYALLHMIYASMMKIKPFDDLTDKKGIIAFGKAQYPFHGTGQTFYKEILLINNFGIYKYIQTRSKKSFRKWKFIIMEISGNDIDVIAWIDKNKY